MRDSWSMRYSKSSYVCVFLFIPPRLWKNDLKNENSWFQIIELSVSEKDIEKEHLAQLRRWKENHGELTCKSPPRMHGAKAIMAAEPPSRLDLRQKPTIIVESPLASKTEGFREEETRKIRKTVQANDPPTAVPPKEFADTYQTHSQPVPLLKPTTLQVSKDSLSSEEHDTYL